MKKSFTNHRKTSDTIRTLTSLPISVHHTCVVCENVKHPLYSCPKFKAMDHAQMVSTVKSHHICLNCLKPGHYVRECGSLHRCRTCQKPHHTLLHVEAPSDSKEANKNPPAGDRTRVTSHTAQSTSKCSQALLMTCCIEVRAPDGSYLRARALLDSASSTSFVTDRLTQLLRLPRSREFAQISGIGGTHCQSEVHPVTRFKVSSPCAPDQVIDVQAVVLRRIICELPPCPVDRDPSWSHLSGIQLADPEFGSPGRIDVLLGVDIFCSVLLNGRRTGPPGSPVAL